MKSLLALTLVTVGVATSPASAQDCPSAEALERRLATTPVEPFIARIEPAKPDQPWPIGSSGGFLMAAPPLGEVTTFLHATAKTSCGLQISWRPDWSTGRSITAASQFKVVQIEDRPSPRASQKVGATFFRVTPDKASQTAWLSITYGGLTSDYLLNFPATTLAAGPVSHHSDGVRLELMGVRSDGALIYADLGGSEPR